MTNTISVGSLDKFVNDLIDIACLPKDKRNGQDNVAVHAITNELNRVDCADTFYSTTKVSFKGEIRGKKGQFYDLYVFESTPDGHVTEDGPLNVGKQSTNYLQMIDSMIQDRVSFLETNVDGSAMTVSHPSGYFRSG